MGFPYGFLCCAKAFKFNQVPFASFFFLIFTLTFNKEWKLDCQNQKSGSLVSHLYKILDQNLEEHELSEATVMIISSHCGLSQNKSGHFPLHVCACGADMVYLDFRKVFDRDSYDRFVVCLKNIFLATLHGLWDPTSPTKD